MQALRQIQSVDTDSINISIPQSFQKHRLEILVFPIDDKAPLPTWSPDFFSQTSGCFADAPVVREQQGVYEKRETIL